MFGIPQEQVAAFFRKLLMVAGGFAAGYLLALLAGVGYDKLLAGAKSPDALHRWGRRIGGVLGALLVAFLVFRGGGLGEGDVGSGGGTTASTAPGSAGGRTTEPGGMTTPTEARPADGTPVEPLRVTVLAGDDVAKTGENFYRLAGQPAAVDRAAVTAAVVEKRRAGGTVAVVYAFGRDAGPKTIAFTDLQTELKQLKVQFLSEDEFREWAKPPK